MSAILAPLLTHKYSFFGSTKINLNLLFTPIQRRYYKDNCDFLEFISRPFIDIVNMPIFAYDTAVSLVNGLVSSLNGLHLWAYKNDPDYDGYSNADPEREFDDAAKHFTTAVSAVVALFLNPIISILSLITRPVTSAITAVGDLCGYKSAGLYDYYA
ncbi:MAG: hypothetical protein QM652_10505 [Legionella sp.]|uniref:hypothetical protein n=1 Tax=Legionella sp. TaxID=459 RepID=UPI0039E62751